MGSVSGCIRSGQAFVVILAVWLSLVTPATAGRGDQYRYTATENKSDRVCRRMLEVYNREFAYPWKTPAMAGTGNPDRAYGPDGRFSFPRLRGVVHDDRATWIMRYSKLPTSPEFTSTAWSEGRYRVSTSLSANHANQPFLVGEVDIDNDGRPETLVKSSFMQNFWPSHDSVEGGEDTIFVFREGDIDLNKTIKFQDFFNGQAGKRKPIMISGSYERRLIRPFVFDRIVYLSAYEQDWEDGEYSGPDTRLLGEYVNVFRYRGGGENLGGGNWSPLDLERICRYRMVAAPRH